MGTVLSLGWAAQGPAVVDWIRGNAVRLTTPQAGHGFDDMQPLKKVIGDARIVSLGEATHGSREFFQLKHRMLEFLATEMGFTIFSIEANMPEAYRLNDYVLNGTGDPAQLLRGMYFWTWDTEEVLEMIRWMRDFNKSGKGRVEFTGFDMQTPNVAAENVRAFVSRYDADYTGSLPATSALARIASSEGGGQRFGVATGKFPVAEAAGKKVRYSGYIKTEGVADGWAGLWWRVDGVSGVLAFDNMEDRGVSGTSDWKRYEIELPVDAAVKNINFGVLMPGEGTAWFDDLAIELDAQPYTDGTLVDLGFESATAKGFFTGGQGYEVSLDPEIRHGGKQSLRIRRQTADPVAPAAPDPKPMASRWKEIVAHLQAGRAAYRAAGGSEMEIDWAIQNARVVLQGMQLRGDEVSRDESMADNVRWIADHNPKAKIVLWAHNGHVAAGGPAGTSMGSFLRRAFGKEMVVFGFAFNQGSFQAMPQGGGRLKTFTVPPAPAGSLDATLAGSGIPLFALDLRQAPDWFKEPHGTRQIGAIYPEGEPLAFVADWAAKDVYDAMLFVESTTAARKNPGR